MEGSKNLQISQPLDIPKRMMQLGAVTLLCKGDIIKLLWILLRAYWGKKGIVIAFGGDFADKKAQDLLMPAVEIYVIYFQLCCKC